jgi:hypothetical protein
MSRAVKGIRLALRIRATICPKRPKPAMITWLSSPGNAS